MTHYPWYEVVGGNSPILQGDIIEECPVVEPPEELVAGEVTPITASVYDVVVMSQSSDLKQKKVDLVLVCAIWPLQEFGDRVTYFGGEEGRERLRRGDSPGYHLLNMCELAGHESDYKVVDFRNVFGVPFDFLVRFVKKRERLRLLPPYREHLSQAFARFFMRVGLPVDIPPFT